MMVHSGRCHRLSEEFEATKAKLERLIQRVVDARDAGIPTGSHMRPIWRVLVSICVSGMLQGREEVQAEVTQAQGLVTSLREWRRLQAAAEQLEELVHVR